MRAQYLKPMIAAALGAVLMLGSSGLASAKDTARAKPLGPQPALWQIKNGASTVYLFGSVHILPRDLNWRTRAIDAAIVSSDEFVFEAPLTPQGAGNVKVFVRENGTLPRGKQLSHMLSPEGLKDFKALLSASPLDPDQVNVMRPWFASMVLEDTVIPADSRDEDLSFFAGVDYTLTREMEKAKKPIRYLETAEGQMAILASTRPDDDLKGFEAGLHELRDTHNVFDRILANWIAGNQPGLAKLEAEDAAKHPMEKKLVLDKRNQNWLPEIEAMLAEKKTIFVTMGAAHLAGPGSVMELLCTRGWKVERLKTGSTPPPPACPAQAAFALRR